MLHSNQGNGPNDGFNGGQWPYTTLGAAMYAQELKPSTGSLAEYLEGHVKLRDVKTSDLELRQVVFTAPVINNCTHVEGRLTRMVQAGELEGAPALLCDVLLIESDHEEMILDLVQLAHEHAEICEALWCGKLGKAHDLVWCLDKNCRATSYLDVNENEPFGEFDVLDIVERLSRYWQAFDVICEAELTRRRIFQPLGNPLLDGEHSFRAPQFDGCTKRFSVYHQTTRRVLYLFENGPKVADGQSVEDYLRQNVPNHDSAEPFLKDAIWRARCLEDQVQTHRLTWTPRARRQVRSASRLERMARAEYESIGQMKKKNVLMATTRRGLPPLLSLLAACESVIAWTADRGCGSDDPGANTDTGLGRARATMKRGPVVPATASDLATALGHPYGKTAPHPLAPRRVKDHGQLVDRLFFVLRATIVRDDAMLPHAAQLLELANGETRRVASFAKVIELRGTDYSCDELVAFAEQGGDEPNAHEGFYAHSIREHLPEGLHRIAVAPNGVAAADVLRAAGNFSWRLLQ